MRLNWEEDVQHEGQSASSSPTLQNFAEKLLWNFATSQIINQ